MKIDKTVLLLVAIGGIVYWAPSLFLHVIKGNKFSRSDEVVLTYLMPFLILMVSLLLIFRFKRFEKKRASSPSAILLGVWISGPSFIVLSMGITEAHLSLIDAFVMLVIGTLIFPLMTVMLSTYDGTLYALFITTAALILLSTKAIFQLISDDLK